MDPQRKLNSIHSTPPKSPPVQNASSQGVATLITMIAVLLIIILFCCLAAPGIRGMCKRYIFRTCAIDDPDLDNVSSSTSRDATPTVILLPYGRMLVVDRRAISRLNTQDSMETMEISANLVREQRPRRLGSTPSILDSSETSKGISPISLGYPPPTYNEVFPDFPPSYSEISLMMKQCETLQLENLRTFVLDETNAVCDNFQDNMNMNREEDTCFGREDDNNNHNSENNDDNNNGDAVDIQDQMNNNVGHIEFVQDL